MSVMQHKFFAGKSPCMKMEKKVDVYESIDNSKRGGRGMHGEQHNALATIHQNPTNLFLLLRLSFFIRKDFVFSSDCLFS